MPLSVFAAVLFGALSEQAAAAPPLSRCQCNYDKWVGTCAATISNENNWVRITSNTQQCSRVDWYIDGNPQMTIVTNGVETEPLLNAKGSAKLVIQACNVCQDAMMPDGPPSTSGGNTQTPKPTLEARSPFAGTWTGTDRNIFGFGHAINVQMSVQGTSITGTWTTDQDVDNISGSLSGSAATISLGTNGAQNMRLQLVDANTLKYSWSFGSGTLKKSQ